MDSNLINAFYKEVPAVICTAGTYIAAKNPSAERILECLSEGERMFEKMAPDDVLKYEAHFESFVSGALYSFPVRGLTGYTYALAAFDSIFGKQFSEVFLFGERSEADEFERMFSQRSRDPDEEKMVSFAHVLLKMPEESFSPENKRGLIDLRTATTAFIDRYYSNHPSFSMDISYSENAQMEASYYMPEDIPMSTYMQLLHLMLKISEGISKDRTVNISVNRFGANAEVRFSVLAHFSLREIADIDELSLRFPFLSDYLSVCSYVAKVARSELLLCPSEETDGFDLVLSIKEHMFENVDFKSRDPLAYFEEAFDFADKYTSSIGSGNAKEQCKE